MKIYFCLGAIEFQCNFVLRPSKVRKLVRTNQFQVKSTKIGTVRKFVTLQYAPSLRFSTHSNTHTHRGGKLFPCVQTCSAFFLFLEVRYGGKLYGECVGVLYDSRGSVCVRRRECWVCTCVCVSLWCVSQRQKFNGFKAKRNFHTILNFLLFQKYEKYKSKYRTKICDFTVIFVKKCQVLQGCLCIPIASVTTR